MAWAAAAWTCRGVRLENGRLRRLLPAASAAAAACCVRSCGSQLRLLLLLPAASRLLAGSRLLAPLPTLPLGDCPRQRQEPGEASARSQERPAPGARRGQRQEPGEASARSQERPAPRANRPPGDWPRHLATGQTKAHSWRTSRIRTRRPSRGMPQPPSCLATWAS